MVVPCPITESAAAMPPPPADVPAAILEILDPAPPRFIAPKQTKKSISRFPKKALAAIPPMPIRFTRKGRLRLMQ